MLQNLLVKFLSLLIKPGLFLLQKISVTYKDAPHLFQLVSLVFSTISHDDVVLLKAVKRGFDYLLQVAKSKTTFFGKWILLSILFYYFHEACLISCID